MELNVPALGPASNEIMVCGLAYLKNDSHVTEPDHQGFLARPQPAQVVECGVTLSRKVVAVDFGSKGDLYVRFKDASRPVGEPSDDGFVVFFYDDGGSPVGLEMLDTEPFT